jgi:serine/threonine-protein kinase
MPTTNPLTNQTSLRGRPALRKVLIILWVAVVLYCVAILVLSLVPPLTYFLNAQGYQAVLGLPGYLLAGFDLGVDLLLIMGFWIIGGLLFVRRSDDWLAILASMFLITFGMRIANLTNTIAMEPRYQALTGVVLALGDIGIVLFMFLFPDGKFAPRWLVYSVPLLVLTMIGLYSIPALPFFWLKLGTGSYLALTTFWYLASFASIVYRYFFQSIHLHKQQIRWVFLGGLGPFLWFVIFELLEWLVPTLAQETLMGTFFHVGARLVSIFAFLILPLFIAVSIARYKTFDIDLLINRSLVYGVLTVGLVLFFAAALGMVTLIFKNFHQGDQSLVALTVAGLGVGALFQPARKKLQHFIDHFFYKIRIDYQKTPAEARAEALTEGGVTTPRLSAYRDLQLIGRGGMAQVYRSEDPVTGQAIAVKVLLSALAEDEQFRRRFLREAEAITRLDHPNIVHIRDCGEEGGVYYIVTDYLTGPALNVLLKQQKKLSMPESVSYLTDIAGALDYAHQQGLVHRDIKPSNVILNAPGGQALRAVLTDFGIAKIADAHTRITATNILGTFDYIAPEQIQADPGLDGRADIYSLGVMAFQLITGQLPFKRNDTGALLLAHMTAPPPDPRDLLPDLPRSASYAIQRAMAKKPADRFPTALDFVSAMGFG